MYIMENPKNKKLPKFPKMIFKNKGWKSWDNYLGKK